MDYLNFLVELDKLDLKFDVTTENMYQESVSSFFIKLSNAFNNYMDDVHNLHRLYKEKRNLSKSMNYVKSLCRYKSIGEQTILVRGYNGKTANPLYLDDAIQVLKNLISYTKLRMNDPKILEYLTRYEYYKAGWDIFYKIKIKDIPYLYEDVDAKLEEAIQNAKKVIGSLSDYFTKASDQKKETSESFFKKAVENIKNSIKKDVNIALMNFEAMQYEIGKVLSKTTEDLAAKMVKKDVSEDDIIKNSKFVKEITYGGDSYKIYQTKYPDISAMNYGGALIYVDSNFFELPQGYQLAILYHEIGHHKNGHFKPSGFKVSKINDGYDVPIENVEELAVRIKKDLKHFNRSLASSKFSNAKSYANGEEFIYLLVEWEADRFSANIIGKRLMRKALTSDFKTMIDRRPAYKDPKTQLIHKKYNMDRMRVRTQNI